jgi:hypothetical protein
MNDREPLTDEEIIVIANDAMFDVMAQGMQTGYVTLPDIHLAIGRSIEQAHGIGLRQ